MLKENIKTKVAPKKVWKAWADTYNWSNKKDHISSKQKGFKSGKKGTVVDSSGRKAGYKIINIEPGKSFTMVWGSIILRMYFCYKVIPQPKGSIISCNVRFGGILVFPVSFFLRKKIRKNLKDSLHQFANQLEMSQPQQRRVYR
jgi:hypothetical protein